TRFRNCSPCRSITRPMRTVSMMSVPSPTITAGFPSTNADQPAAQARAVLCRKLKTALACATGWAARRFEFLVLPTEPNAQSGNHAAENPFCAEENHRPRGGPVRPAALEISFEGIRCDGFAAGWLSVLGNALEQRGRDRIGGGL